MLSIIRSKVTYLAILAATLLGLGLPVTTYAQTSNDESRFRAAGEVSSVDAADASFTLQTLRGESLVITTDADTQFRPEAGEIQGVGDLAVGMKAIVLGIVTSDGEHLARQVGAAAPGTIQRRVVRKRGIISSVVPGQSIFSVQTAQGDELEFHVTDRTHFVSRDGSLEDIHDLKKDMRVRVAALAKDDGGLEALLVALVPEDAARPGSQVDVRKAGRIVELGDRTLVLQTRDGSQVSIAVDAETAYRSVQRGIQGFDDLKVGMVAIVGADEDNGRLTAVWIAAGRVRPLGPGQGESLGPAGGPIAPAPSPSQLPSS
jgi:hypothetical protein